MIAATEEVEMWAIAHVVFVYLHFIPGANGGWTEGPEYPRFSTEERQDMAIPFEGYWQRVS
jgi:hypothetical protein